MRKKKESSDIEMILAHLQNHGVEDKDASLESTPINKTNTNRIIKKVARHTLNLHGMKSEEARRSIKITLDSCAERGIKEILIIHGKGHHSNVNEGPVLKGLVHTMLEHEYHYLLRDFRPAPLKDGGDGATLVYLK